MGGFTAEDTYYSPHAGAARRHAKPPFSLLRISSLFSRHHTTPFRGENYRATAAAVSRYWVYASGKISIAAMRIGRRLPCTRIMRSYCFFIISPRQLPLILEENMMVDTHVRQRKQAKITLLVIYSSLRHAASYASNSSMVRSARLFTLIGSARL